MSCMVGGRAAALMVDESGVLKRPMDWARKIAVECRYGIWKDGFDLQATSELDRQMNGYCRVHSTRRS